MLWDMRLSNDSLPAAADGQPANFERDPNAPQYLVLAFPRDSVSANQLLYDVARFNFSSFVVQDFDLEPMSFGNVGLLVVKGFNNLKALEHYRSVMTEKGFMLPDGVRPIMISKSNFELLLREGRSFEEYFRFEENPEQPPIPEQEELQEEQQEAPQEPQAPQEQPQEQQEVLQEPQEEGSEESETIPNQELPLQESGNQ